MLRRTGATLTATLVLGLLVASGSQAAAPESSPSRASRDRTDVTITKIDTSAFPRVRVGYGADAEGTQAPDLIFREDGEPLTGVSTYIGELGRYDGRRRTDVMLVLDTSLSMGAGTRIKDATSAALGMLEHARPEDRIGLVTFGGKARVVVAPTIDHGRIGAALGDVKLSNRTTMFDAVSKASQAFSGNANRAIVLLSDGTDAGSIETLTEASGEALKARAPVYAISIRENASEQPADLSELGNSTGGELRTVTRSSELGPLFDELGRQLLQPYWIEYRSSAPLRSTAKLSVAHADAPGRTLDSTTFRAIARGAAAATTAPVAAQAPPAPLLPIPGGLLGALLASVPFAILIFSVVWTYLHRRSTPDVIARVERYTTQSTAASIRTKSPESDRPRLVQMAQPLVTFGERFLGTSAFFDRMRFRAEQAAIAVKPGEMFAAMITMGLLGLTIGLLTGGRLLVIVFLVPIMFYMPAAWLRIKARGRKRRFDGQLADVLGGIASSLQAGHSFNQAINAMIKDVPSPTSEEFSRVMTEARLGMPIEEALQHMAERMGSADFEFAVTTINIQRTVGGSLAEILEMVSDTVRNRQQFRKKVQALTSMGQMSAYVLLGMPIFMCAMLSLINPEYMAPLWQTETGHMMLGAAAFSMTLGYFASMKVVSVKI